MLYMPDYKEDALQISDEQVASDWRFGLLRNIAQYMRYGALPSDDMGRFGITIAGSNREHMSDSSKDNPACPIVTLYEVSEEQDEEHIFSTFGGSTHQVVLLSALATCKCGKLQKHPVSMTVSPGEHISAALAEDGEGN